LILVEFDLYKALNSIFVFFKFFGEMALALFLAPYGSLPNRMGEPTIDCPDWRIGKIIEVGLIISIRQ